MKLAVFDIDGTLTQTMGQTDGLFLSVVSEVLEADDLPRDWSGYPHATDSGILQHLFGLRLGRAPRHEETEVVRGRYMRLLRERCQTASAVLGAPAALQAIGRSRDWAVAIATGNWLAPAHHKLGICGVPFAGLPMATADDSHDRRDILRLAIERAGAPAQAVYLGDRDWDRDAAAEVGVGFVAVGQRVKGSPLQLDDLSDVSALWSALEAAAR